MQDRRDTLAMTVRPHIRFSTFASVRVLRFESGKIKMFNF